MLQMLGALLLMISSLLGLSVYVWTIGMGYQESLWMAISAAILPVIGQIYQCLRLWLTTGAFFNPYSIACLSCLATWSLGCAFHMCADSNS